MTNKNVSKSQSPDGIDQNTRGFGLQESSHIFNAKYMGSSLNQFVREIQIVIQVVFCASRIT